MALGNWHHSGTTFSMFRKWLIVIHLHLQTTLCHLCGGRRNTLATVCVWRSEDNLKEWVLLFFVGSGNQTQVTRFRGKLLYTLSLLLDLLEARAGTITGVIFQLLLHVGASFKMWVPRLWLWDAPVYTQVIPQCAKHWCGWSKLTDHNGAGLESSPGSLRQDETKWQKPHQLRNTTNKNDCVII